MMQVQGTVKERGEKNGAVFFILTLPQGSANRTAKLWAGNEYKGEVPDVGGQGTATFHEEPVGDYQIKKLEAWEGSLGSPQNGSQTPPDSPGGHRFVGREPGTADFFLAMRWAYSLAADLLPRGEGAPSVSDISRLAGELFHGAYSDALSAKEQLETPSE